MILQMPRVDVLRLKHYVRCVTLSLYRGTLGCYYHFLCTKLRKNKKVTSFMIARTTNLICIKIGIVYSKTFPFISILIMLGVEGVNSDQMDEPTIIK